MKRAAIAAVDAVEEIRLREVLDCYYIKGYTWQQTADALHLDVRWVYRLHGRALKCIEIKEEDEKA